MALIAAGALLASAPGRAESPAPQREPEPSGFACTVQTLGSGADCVLESSDWPAADAAAQAKENVGIASALATEACGAAARDPLGASPDPAVRARCEQAFKARAATCAIAGVRPILDSGGRFAPEARACYVALAEVLAQARTATSVSVSCCQCLASAGCAEATSCHQQLLSGAPSAATVTCARKACPDACGALLPSPPSGASAIPAPPAPPEPPDCRDPLRLERRCVHT